MTSGVNADPNGVEGIVNALPKMRAYEDVVVVPASKMAIKAFDGGPIWTDWDASAAVRHVRRDRPVDAKPDMPGMPIERLEGEYLWGGQAVPHFGHFVSEQTDRILPSLLRYPDTPFLVTALNGKDGWNLPGFVRAVHDWFGVAPHKVRIVDRPYRVDRLQVSPQIEPLPDGKASAAYLDLLELNERRRGLQPIPNKVLYVSRAGRPNGFFGISAGEGYVERLMAEAGAVILRPETETLSRQLSLYAGAETIIFAEGSAIHGRQLLGRKDQRIVVLLRRPSRSRSFLTGHAAMSVRASSVKYVDTARDLITAIGRNGNPILADGLTLYNRGKLLSSLEAAGLDVRDAFDKREFAKAQNADIVGWYKKSMKHTRRIDGEASRAAIKSKLSEHNLSTLANRL